MVVVIAGKSHIAQRLIERQSIYVIAQNANQYRALLFDGQYRWLKIILNCSQGIPKHI